MKLARENHGPPAAAAADAVTAAVAADMVVVKAVSEEDIKGKEAL
jgi:hypothetical protein